MHNFKKITALLLALVLSFSLFACAKGNEGTKDEGKPTEPSHETVPTQEKPEIILKDIEVRDQLGRKVVLPEVPEKIVSTYYISTYAMLALGLKDKLVGIEKKADTRALYHLSAPELLKLPQVGSMKEFNAEAVIALKPDLVLLPMKLKDHVQTFEKVEIPVIVVNPESMEKVETMIEILGTACGVTTRAYELLAYYKDTLAEKTKLISGTERPSVYMGSNSSLLSTAPKNMYQSDLITLAGGKNVAEDLEGDYWMDISYEKLLAYNPDYVIIPSGAKYSVESVLKDTKLASLTAVKEGHVYKMPEKLEEWDSPSTSCILGVMWTVSKLHPELYTYDQFIVEARGFYKAFYGCNDGVPAEDLFA